MQVLVTLEFRFTRTPDGQVWTRTTYRPSFWERYLTVFDGVKIVARAEHRNEVDDQYCPIIKPGIEFIEVPYYLGPQQYLKVRGQMRKVLRAVLAPDDAVLCRVPSRVATDLLPTVWRERRPYGLEVVGDPEEAFAPGAVKHPLRRLFRYTWTRDLKAQCRRAAALSYVTEYTLQMKYPARLESFATGVADTDLKENDFSAHSRAYVTNYSSAELSNEDYAQSPKVYLSPIRRKVLFIGSLEQMYKGQDTLIRAVSLLMKRHFPVELRMVGEGKHREELEELAGSLSVSQNVCFIGGLPAGEVIRRELDDASLMVLPSRTEGLPRVILEAMARALPCIATRVGGIPEVIDAEDLVSPNDPIALADKMEMVLLDPERLSRMSARNLEWAQKFRPEVLEKRRTEFYRSVRIVTERWVASQGRLEEPSKECASFT